MRFHGKLTRAWVLGPTGDVPKRILPVMRLVSPVRFFDEPMLELARWISERYVAPLAAVLGAISPPRVAGEDPEGGAGAAGGAASLHGSAAPRHDPPRLAPAPPRNVFASYSGGKDLLVGIERRRGAFVVRPAPEDEVAAAIEAVAACVAAGRQALVLVPEASPLPATARALREAFGDRVCMFAGGDKRARYRTWLSIRDGEFDVVVGTRPAVFAPMIGLGLIWVSRESHPAHRQERAPYYHVRDVALRRGEIAGATCVLSALCPSSEAAALGLPTVAPVARKWPKVEVVKPGREGRATRLIEALRQTKRGFLFSPLPGYGVAAVCASCSTPAACSSCGGMLRSEEGRIACVVCGSVGVCASCGSGSFKIKKGGAERVEEWAAREAGVPLVRPQRPRLPKASGEILIGGPEGVRDLGVGNLELVAILDADSAERRPGLTARERALAVWMEAVGWARPNGRAIVQSSHGGAPEVQALVRGNPDRFHAREFERRERAGFPVGSAVFRVLGDGRLEEHVEGFGAGTALVTSLEGRTVCLLALELGQVSGFGSVVRELATRGIVERVEAEPHL